MVSQPIPSDDQERRRHEQLRAAGRSDHPEHRAQNKPADGDDQDQRQASLEQRQAERRQDRHPIGRERRDEHQERDHGEVLKEQDGESGAAEARDLLAAFHQELQDERRRAKRERAADYDRRWQVGAEQAGGHADHTRRQHHLQAAKPEHQPAHDLEPRERQLETDGEQQKGDAQLGQQAGQLGFDDQPERVRADQDAGDQIADDRARPQPPEQRHHDDRRQQENQQLMED